MRAAHPDRSTCNFDCDRIARWNIQVQCDCCYGDEEWACDEHLEEAKAQLLKLKPINQDIPARPVIPAPVREGE